MHHPLFGATSPNRLPGVYAKGVTFAVFLDGVESHADDWRKRYSNAAVSADIVTRLRALPERRRLLVIAEDYCSDSTQTVPYVARLVDAAPARLELRVLKSRTGRRSLTHARRTAARHATLAFWPNTPPDRAGRNGRPRSRHGSRAKPTLTRRTCTRHGEWYRRRRNRCSGDRGTD